MWQVSHLFRTLINVFTITSFVRSLHFGSLVRCEKQHFSSLFSYPFLLLSYLATVCHVPIYRAPSVRSILWYVCLRLPSILSVRPVVNLFFPPLWIFIFFRAMRSLGLYSLVGLGLKNKIKKGLLGSSVVYLNSPDPCNLIPWLSITWHHFYQYGDRLPCSCQPCVPCDRQYFDILALTVNPAWCYFRVFLQPHLW